MAAEQFDTLTRIITTNPSRRGVVRLLAGMTVLGVLGGVLPPVSEAQKGNGNKRQLWR
jgi:hypothetical protein